MYVFSARQSGTFGTCICNMWVLSDWYKRTFKTCIFCPCTCAQAGPVGFRGHSECVYVHARVLRLVQWDIQRIFRTCVCTCMCTQIGPVRHPGEVQYVCMSWYVFSDWSSGTFRTCVCPCTCSQAGPVEHSERVYVHVSVIRLVQWDIQGLSLIHISEPTRRA